MPSSFACTLVTQESLSLLNTLGQAHLLSIVLIALAASHDSKPPISRAARKHSSNNSGLIESPPQQIGGETEIP